LPVVLVAFVLVLLAAATFAAGIAASRTSDTLVYLSIFFSLAAFVVLAIASLRARQAEREAGDVEPAPMPTGAFDETEAHAGSLVGGLDASQLDMTPSWRRSSRERWDTILEGDEEDEDEQALEEQLENEEDEADFEVPVAPVAAGRLDEFHWATDDDDVEVDDEPPTAAFTPALDDELDEFDEFDELDVLDIPEPELEPETTFFDEYDDLTAAEILPSLRDLDLEGLEWVRTRERAGANRTTVLTQVERLIVDQGGRASRATARKRTTAKKTTGKKAAPARRAAKKSTRRR
jgi:hypothetical protein